MTNEHSNTRHIEIQYQVRSVWVRKYLKGGQYFSTSYNLKMKELSKKLKKHIGEHKLLYFFVYFLLL